MKISRDMSAWKGRVDQADGDLALRWHQVVLPSPPTRPGSGLTLLGFASDAGVRRNLGRPGAAKGPDAIRRQLANLPVRRWRDIVDAGTLVVEADELEAAQEAFADQIAVELRAGRQPIGLGGGHEIALGSFLGLAAHLQEKCERPTIGILNVDSHFDLRSAQQGNSGTPFRQIAEKCFADGWPFRYACFGISPYANTEALFQRARGWDVTWRLDEEMGLSDLAASLADVEKFVSGVEHLYLTICLDVLPASVAPGVSAPSAGGVALAVVEKIVDAACASGKLRLADVAELNPVYDEDGRTAKVAARLIGRIAEGWINT